jgi:hypothetical protein
LAALQFAIGFVLMAGGALIGLLGGALSLYFHWKDLQNLRHQPPMVLQVLERHMQHPASGSPDEARIRKLQTDYEQMTKFRQSTLVGAVGLDVLMLAFGAFCCTQLRPKKIRVMFQTRRDSNSRKRVDMAQQDPRPRWARLSLLAGSTVGLAGCVFLLIHFRIELARVQASPPLKHAALKFYMMTPAPGSSDVLIVRQLLTDYANMEDAHERHLKATLWVLLVLGSVCGFTLLFQMLRLWPRKAQPQPQIENTPATQA